MTFSFLFPGQGSQSVGMMNAFAEMSTVTETFEEASSILRKDMWQLAQSGTQDQLAITTNTQPLMLISDIAMYRTWIQLGGSTPTILAGHSLGEYAALVAAGTLEFSDALSLVQQRSILMQNAVPPGVGAMAAVLGLTDEDIELACERAMAKNAGIAEAANYNAPGQVVIAGDKNTVEIAIDEAKSLGAKRATLLAMATPSHCSLIKPAADLFLSALNAAPMNVPKIPVIHNQSVSTSSTVEDIRNRLYEQLFSPVRWVETIRDITGTSTHSGLECGPGKVITGIEKRIDREFTMLSLASQEEMELAINELSRGKG